MAGPMISNTLGSSTIFWNPSTTIWRVTFTLRMDCFIVHSPYWRSGTGAGPTYWLEVSASRPRSRPAPVRSKT